MYLATDNKPIPKPHFAAPPPPPPKLAAAILPVPSSSSHGSRPSLVSAPPSRSSSSSSTSSSRVPRPSVGGFGTSSRLSQLMQPPPRPAPKAVTLTDKEIDERVRSVSLTTSCAQLKHPYLRRSHGQSRPKLPDALRSTLPSACEKTRPAARKKSRYVSQRSSRSVRRSARAKRLLSSRRASRWALSRR